MLLADGKILFVWKLNAQQKEAAFHIEVFDKSGTVVAKNLTAAESIELSLDPGRYRWRVSLQGKKIKSPLHAFEVLSPLTLQSSSQRRALLKSLMLQKKNVVVAFDEL